MEEHRISNPAVVGSTPSRITKNQYVLIWPDSLMDKIKVS